MLLLLVVHGAVYRRAELRHALAKRAGESGQALGAKHNQRNRPQEQQMNRALDSHVFFLAAVKSHCSMNRLALVEQKTAEGAPRLYIGAN